MYQLRIYDIVPGKLDEFLPAMGAALEVRRRFGFEVIGPWVTTEGQVVWIAGHDGDFEEATATYYASGERAALRPDPADFVAHADLRMMTRP